MPMELLRVDFVNDLLDQNGLKHKWVINQMGLSVSAGALMLREGVLPKNVTKKKNALAALADILGIRVAHLLVRIENE